MWGSVLSTLQKLTRLIVATILRCKSNHGPHFTDQEEKLLVDKTAQLKAARQAGTGALLFDTMLSCFFTW